ncbi:glycosyltransferase family 4 protein [Hyphococcus flavus]|uniref:Glycosyltransferase family 4 protein n=1 Tax=Hyphococcus flavus TaxID=1866326 RepID=A0AAE9ZE58_9PROT|nr:glycosyltransferase family 4 protein [Hyphococcus flavus]WDI31372.1 glycosyltransferase family 4 protein [Hyphococcus flavus]
MTLLHVFPSFGYGGQQSRLAALVRALGSEFRHYVLSLDEDVSARALFDDDAPAEFNTYQMKKSHGLSVTNVLTFRKLISNTNPDVLCTYNWGSIEAVVANRAGARKPHIHFEDGFGPDEISGKRNARRAVARRFALRNSTVVTPSQNLFSIARTDWRLKPDQVLHIRNGVDIERLQVRQESDQMGVTVGSLGALRPEKNYARLIKAFVKADHVKRARLRIAGDGPERSALAKLIGTDPRVSLLGATADPANVYAQFDIFALSSDTEQAPLSLMEAMAAGLPVVATNVGDIAEMVAEENRPYITRVGDNEAFVEALMHLLQNPSARAEIGAANRRHAREEFSLDKMIEAHRDLYLKKANGNA